MVESTYKTPDIVLGFLEAPKNSLILTSRYLPNKAGGTAAFLSAKDLPGDRCEHCDYKLVFLMQLYACLDEESEEHHRILYVFTCLSPQCIGDQRAVRFYRGYAQDDGARFAPAKEWDKVSSARSDDDLVKAGLLKKTPS